MLDHDYQPPPRLLAQMLIAATERGLPQAMADRLAHRPGMTVDRLQQLAPGLVIIQSMADRNHLGTEDQAQALDAFLQDIGIESSVDGARIESSARGAIQNILAANDQVGARTTGHGVGDSWDHGPGLRAKLTDAFEARLDPTRQPTIGREFAHATIGDFCMALAHSKGLRPMNRAEAVRMEAGGAGHTTGDFAIVGSNALSNFVGRGFEQRQPNLAAASREVQRDDYQQGRAVTLSSTGVPAEILQASEITFTTIDEKGEFAPRIRDFGSGFNISQAALVNDRLDLFQQIGDKMLRGAIEAFRGVLLAPLLANSGTGQNMADGNPLFTVARGNTLAAGTALSIANLSIARTAMRKQRGSRGELLAIEPAILTVPAELETVAQQFVATLDSRVATDVNPFGGKLRVICEPGLTSPIAWYLSADPALNDGLTHAFLSGQRTPRVESRPAWDTLGMQFRLVWAMDAKFIETASWFRNPGA